MEKISALTVEEVAIILKIAKNTVYELIKRGDLPSYRVGRKVRIDMNDVDLYINKGKSHNTTSQAIASQTQHPNQVQKTISLESFVICGQDVLLDILSRYLARHTESTHPLRSYVGSYNGLIELYHGRAQLATAHLWDGDSNDYNTPYVRRLLPGIPCFIVNLAYRTQGFYVQKGNPKKIKDWSDLTRQDIEIINRERGSGTRVLLDEKLRLLKLSSKSICGYSNEEYSHLSIASAVARKSVDLGIGNEKAALQVDDIDFIPLQKERYDLIIKKEDFNAPVNGAVMSIINSSQFKNELRGLGGYDISNTGKIIAET